MVKRPVLVACIGYIIGIIYGLYFKSIAPFFIILASVIAIYILVNRKIKRLFKILFSKKAILIFLITVIIAYININIQNQKYNEIYKINKEVEITGVVEKLESQKYTNKYILKLKTIDEKKYNNKKIILHTKTKLDIGDYIKFKAQYTEPEDSRNYKSFSYKNYLKQKKIVGTVKNSKEILVLKKNQLNYMINLSNAIKKLVKNESDVNLGINNSGIFMGILLGEKSNISDDMITSFKESSMMHILAVSGAHVSYVIIFFSFILNKISKRKYAVFLCMALVLFMFLTEFTPSVVRACVMAIIVLLSKILYEKSDTYTNISISCLVLLFDNPYNILNIGFILTFLGTLGIVIFSPKIAKVIKIKERKELTEREKIIQKVKHIILSALVVSISVQIMIMPIIILNFNFLTFNFIISGIVTVPIFAGIMFLGILVFFMFPIRVILFKLVNILINFLIFLSKTISNITFLTYTVVTPNIFYVIVYYLILAMILALSSKTLIRIIKSKIKMKNMLKRIIIFSLVFSLIFQLFQIVFSRKLQIHFIDVGQGDSSLIITPSNKNILIDGGGLTDDNYDIGKKLLVPYLLDRGIKTIDYMMVSHFDNDHCGGLMYVLEKLNVKNILISKQSKICKEYENFIDLANKKKINIVLVKAGDVINIERDIKFYVLYPFNELEFDDLNNNSIVAKLVYKDFSILFTGDIEQVAEKRIADKYGKSVLKSTVLKVPHHGSKTSSTENFINLVQPKIALIGVGKNNNFGHPNGEVIERYKNLRNKNL